MSTHPLSPSPSAAVNGDEVLGSVVRGPAAVPGSVLDRFDEQVRRAPQAPALLDGDRHWTYAELDGLARRTTDALRESVSGGDVIGVCMDHSAALVATAISVARLGAVYLRWVPARVRSGCVRSSGP